MAVKNNLAALRSIVSEHNHCLTDTVVESIVAFASRLSISELRHASPLYERAEKAYHSDPAAIEYYAIVDSSGKDTSGCLRHRPDLPLWLKAKGESLYVAHWLVHVLGLRHICVHLLIDTPPPTKYVLAQLRSFDSLGAPGKFDLPVSGHVPEDEAIEVAIIRELKEELGLDPVKHLADERLEQIAAYLYEGSSDSASHLDVEWRVIFSATLRAEALNSIHFLDREVAGLIMLHKDVLCEFLDSFDEKIASGLRFSAPFYFVK